MMRALANVGNSDEQELRGMKDNDICAMCAEAHSG